MKLREKWESAFLEFDELRWCVLIHFDVPGGKGPVNCGFTVNVLEDILGS